MKLVNHFVEKMVVNQSQIAVRELLSEDLINLVRRPVHAPVWELIVFQMREHIEEELSGHIRYKFINHKTIINRVTDRNFMN